MSDVLTTPRDDDPEGMKSLRAALKKAQDESAKAAELLAELSKKDRTRTIRDKFADEYKADPDLAKFVPTDLPVDKIDEWVGENAKFFGIQLGQQAPAADPAHDAQRQAQSRISSITPSSMPVDDPDLKAVLDVGSEADLRALIESAQAGKR